MNTLHLCHWRNRKHLMSHLSLIDKHDSLVIYGSIEPEDEQWISQNIKPPELPWYLVKQHHRPNITHEIDSDQWLHLIIEHKKTLAWK